MRTVPFYYRVDRRDIAFLRFIVEAYEGIAVLSTVDQRTGLVVLHVPAGCQESVSGLMKSLSTGMRIDEVIL